MILFADTSALVKLYMRRPEARPWWSVPAEQEWLAASVLAYAEIYADVRTPPRSLTRTRNTTSWSNGSAEWQSVIVMALRPPLVARVPRLVRDHPLRGADAVHLVSALSLLQAGVETVFAASDRRLVEAAAQEGIEVFNPARGRATR